MDIIIVLFFKVVQIGLNLLIQVKDMQVFEKLFVVFLFVIPIPFTMEGYFILKTAIKASKKITTLSPTHD